MRKKLAVIALVVFALIFVGSVPSDARGGHGGAQGAGRGGGGHGHGFHHGGHARGFVGFGPGIWWDPWWGPYYPYGYYPPPYYGYAPPFVEPPIYVEAPTAQGYWHYCMSAQAYYPSVETCAEGWVKVAPKSE